MAKRPAAAQQKAEVMIAEPGQQFIAKLDCFIGKCIKEGEPVPFSPGQEVPLNLVRLVDDTVHTSTDNGADAQESLTGSEDSLQGGDSGGDDQADASGDTGPAAQFTA